MSEDNTIWKNTLIAIGAAALLIVGLGIIIYVGIARDRIAPTPTPPPTATAMPAPTDTLLTEPTEEQPPIVSVSGIVREYSPGALIIIIAPDEGDVEQIIVPENLTVTWSSGNRASPREIAPGHRVQAQGQMDVLGRLIAERIVIDEASWAPTATFAARPTARPISPTPTSVPPSPTPPEGWLGEYFDNADLEGVPLLARADQLIDFQWQRESPAPQVPADGFSIRWRGRWSFDEGGYRFYTFTDDGVRLWVDGILIIDEWHDQPATLASAELYVPAGEHDVQVEYYDSTADAQIRVWWDYLGAYPDWRGEYFSNPGLSGEPLAVRNDLELRFNWGAGAPAPGLPPDDFSARWVRQVKFEENPYRFLARGDDGIRVWVDGLIVIDEWHASTADTYVGHTWLDGGTHEIRVEFYENAGDANIQVWWEPITHFELWQAEYYANPDLIGRPVFVRDDSAIDFNWGENSPGHGIPVDNFSIRWMRIITFAGGDYRFWAEADDGVRLYVDGQILIDEWTDSPLQRIENTAALVTGEHLVEVEYYERGGQAIVRAGWREILTPTPTITPTATATPKPPTATPVPTTSLPPTATQTLEPTATSTPLPPSPEPTATATDAPPTTTPTVAPQATEEPTPCETCSVPRPETPTATPENGGQ